MDLKRVALHDIHLSLGAKMVPFAGYEMPVRYTSDIEEHLAVRKKVGVFDVSHMGEFFISGSHAQDLIQKVSSNDAKKLAPGKAQYSCLPNDKGGIVDDLIVYMLNETDYMLVVNASNIEKDFEWIRSQDEWGVDMYNASDEYSLFAVQGPMATAVLQKIAEINLSDIPFYHFTIGNIGGVEEVIISATGYTGAGGFELYVRNESAEELWKTVFNAGQSEGIQPIGLGARDTLRLEKGYCLYGNDIDDTTSPLEAGLGWITKFTKPFIHSAELAAEKERGISKKLIGFKMLERSIPRKGYEILDESGQVIGKVTSGSQSPSLGYGIGLGYVRREFGKPGNQVHIKIRNKTVPAEIVKIPFL
jgi:aminomethyltransferase